MPDYLLAIALLNMPAGTPMVPVPTPCRASVQAGLRAVASQWDAIPPGSDGWFRDNDSDAVWQSDLDICRRRIVEMRDAPPLADARRFYVPPKLPTDFPIWPHPVLGLNRAYRTYLVERQEWEFDRYQQLAEVIRETDELFEVWRVAVDAAQPDDPYRARVALRQLRELLGEEAYNRAELPPTVPIWRFNDLP